MAVLRFSALLVAAGACAGAAPQATDEPVLSGHPLLARAAREAVARWIYRPTLAGNKPVRVITTIEVPFRLDSQRSPTRQGR
jgi:hypothetical protein